MILGIGNDIIGIDRIRAVLIRYPERFLNRIFTLDEQKYCLKYRDPAPRLAGRFAAKEAIVKALGTGFSQGLSWLDIEIHNDLTGKPVVSFSNFAKEIFGTVIYMFLLAIVMNMLQLLLSGQNNAFLIFGWINSR